MVPDLAKNKGVFKKALLFGIVVDALLVGLGLIVFPTMLQEPGAWLGLTAS
jgi:hypothetical protein